MSFVDWLFGRGGIPGNYDYALIYIISMIIIFLICVAFGIVAGSKLSAKTKKIVLYSIAIFQLSFEVLWRIIYLFRGDKILSLWPYYICNLNGILIPIAVLTNSKVMKNLFYVFGFIGGVITMALPQGIFNNALLIFPILKSLLQHTGLLIIPLYEYIEGTFRPKLSEIWYAIVGLLIHVVNAVLIAKWFGYPGDYLYFNSGLPFTIPGVPGWIIVCLTAVVVTTIFYVAMNAGRIIKYFSKKKIKS